MPTNLTITDDALAARAQAEADRQYGGDLNAAATAALTYYLSIADARNSLADRVPEQAGDTEAQRLARAVAAAGVNPAALSAEATTIAGIAADATVDPGPVAAMIKPLLGWSATDKTHQVGATLVTTQAASGDAANQSAPPVGYAHGTLRGGSGTLRGDLQEYFSDRTYGAAGSPFDPGSTESLGVAITMDPLTTLVTVQLISHAWGDATQTLTDLRVQSGVLLARGAGAGNLVPDGVYALTLFPVTLQ